MKYSYFLIDSFKPVECFNVDSIDFVKYYYNTSNVIRLSYKQYKKVYSFYQDYIIKLNNFLKQSK